MSSITKKFMKTILLLSLFAFLPFILPAQDFHFKCSYTKDVRTPSLFYVPQNNVLYGAMYNKVDLIKDSGYSAHIILRPSKISFFKIGTSEILVSPGDKSEGLFNMHSFQPNDSNSINFTFSRISQEFSRIHQPYSIGSDFKEFKSVVGLLKGFIDSTNKTLDKKTKPWLTNEIVVALKEYLSAKLAHFLVLPVLFNNDYDKKELNSMIRKNVQLRYPPYWLQIESGRIFLETYYRKISLPESNFNLEKSLEDKFYAYKPIRKLAAYNYFKECMEKATVKTRMQLSEDWTNATSTLPFSNKEQEVMKIVKTNIEDIGKNISDLFGMLPLVNPDGKILTIEEKMELISGKNIILDFWASWCVPCREKMSKLNSDKVIIDQKTYRIIYLSADQDDKSWKGATYSFLNKTNSFRITDGNNPFVKELNINTIPRYVLINESGLMSADFSY